MMGSPIHFARFRLLDEPQGENVPARSYVGCDHPSVLDLIIQFIAYMCFDAIQDGSAELALMTPTNCDTRFQNLTPGRLVSIFNKAVPVRTNYEKQPNEQHSRDGD